jgi:SAM-dependent methyltransferase
VSGEPTAQELSRVRSSYDTVAETYDQHISAELAGKPLDRALLDAFAEQVPAGALVLDLGCGPGHVTRYLADRGCQMLGVDLSPGMVTVARRRHPDLDFRTGSMLCLDAPGLELGKHSVGGVLAFYSIIHLPDEDIARALAGIHRVLMPAGLLLLAVHASEGPDAVVHADTWWAQPVDLDFRFLDPVRLEDAVVRAGFVLQATVRRRPYPDVEHPSRRAYLLASRS